MEFTAVLAALVFIVPMCFSPGPNNMLCAAHGSQHGIRASIPLTLGMLVGWSMLGLLVGMAATFIEENVQLFQYLTYVGALYIAYLAYKIATSTPVEEADEQTQRFGFGTGAFMQILNGKAWVHFLVLMTTFGATFGTGFGSKVALVLLNASMGYPAVLSWTTFGSSLKRLFGSPIASARLNYVLAASLLGVGIWIALPH